jgi:putative SOS response-associated peptidase YedK
MVSPFKTVVTNPETGEPVSSCTIIVSDANALTRPIHDRMPVLLDKADFEPWLSGAAGAELLRPAAEDPIAIRTCFALIPGQAGQPITSIGK